MFFFAKELKIHDMNLKSSKHGLNNSFFKLDNHPGNVNYWYIDNCVWNRLEFAFIQTFLVSIWLYILRFSFILRICIFTFPSIRPFVTFCQIDWLLIFIFLREVRAQYKSLKWRCPFLRKILQMGKMVHFGRKFLELFSKSFHQIFMKYSWQHSWKEC